MGVERIRAGLTRGAALRLARHLDTIDGYPSRGVTRGKPLTGSPAQWDGTGPTPPGWTRHGIEKHPDRDEYEVRIPRETMRATEAATRRARLSETDRAELDGHIAATVDKIDTAWTRDAEEIDQPTR